MPKKAPATMVDGFTIPEIKQLTEVTFQPIPPEGVLVPPTLISQPTRIQAAGNKRKLIDEYIGRINSKTGAASVAHMRSPSGWLEPGQTPEFKEFTIVLKGVLRVEHKNGGFDVHARQAVITHAGEWVRCDIRRRIREARSTLPYAFRLSPWRQCIAMSDSAVKRL